MATAPTDSPSLVHSDDTGNTLTTDSFDVDSGTVLVASAHRDGAGHSSWPALTNGGDALTWHQIARVYDDSTSGWENAGVWAYYAVVPESQSGLTVTVTFDGGNQRALHVQAFTGADQSNPIGAVLSGATVSDGLTTAALTAEGTGSLLYASTCYGRFEGNLSSDDPDSHDLDSGEVYNANSELQGIAGYKSFSGGSATVSAQQQSSISSAQWNWVLVEVQGTSGSGGDPPIVDAGGDVVDWPIGETFERIGTYDLNGGTLDGGGWDVRNSDGEIIASVGTEGVTFAPSVVGTWTFEFHITTEYGTSTDSFTLTSVEPDQDEEGPAYIVVRTTGESANDTLNHVVAMPSGIQQGDLILVAFTHDNATAVPSAPAPWYNGPEGSEWLQVNGSSTNLGGVIFTYENSPAGGPGDLTVTITDAANGADKATWVVYVIRRAGSPVLVAGDNGGNSTAADIAPLNGLADGYLSILAVGVDCNTDGFVPSLTVPSGYGNETEAVPAASGSVATLLVEAELGDQVSVPSSVTYSEVTQEQWVSFNIAIPPGVGGPEPDPETRRFYLTSTAASHPVTSTASWWNDASAASSSSQLGLEPAGSPTTRGIDESSSTSPYFAMMGRWVSTPTATAGTMYAPWRLTAGFYESDADADAYPFLNVWVTEGATENMRGGAPVISRTVESFEFPTNEAASEVWAEDAGTGEAPVSFQPGDRIVVEFGAQLENSSSDEYSTTFHYGGTSSTDLSPNDTDFNRPAWVELDLSPGVTFEEPAPVIYPTRFFLAC